MYTIRVDATRRLLDVEIGAAISVEDAMRATSQAFTLAEAGSITRILCDLSRLATLPEGASVLVPLIAARHDPDQRIAVIVPPRTRPALLRLARRAAPPGAIAVFTSGPAALQWLQSGPRLGETERRHLRSLPTSGGAARTTGQSPTGFPGQTSASA